MKETKKTIPIFIVISIILVLIGIFIITKVNNNNKELNSKTITIEPINSNIKVGDKIQIKVSTNIKSEEKIIFESSNTNVATIDENGLLTATSAGSTAITAYLEDYSDTIIIEIN